LKVLDVLFALFWLTIGVLYIITDFEPPKTVVAMSFILNVLFFVSLAIIHEREAE
jgi:hypothetical protein